MKYEISEKLKESIMNRYDETSTGRISVPTDLINRVRKETGTTDPNWEIRLHIRNYVSHHARL